MTTPNKGKYGEPWAKSSYNAPIGDTGDYEGVIEIFTRNNEMRVAEAWNPEDENELAFDRAIQCVNLCDGHDMDAVEIVSKETLEEVRNLLGEYRHFLRSLDNGDATRVNKALRKLTPSA